MRRVILHIGRQKTGTTAIQKFLHANSTLLDSHDIYYPKYGIRGYGQHEIGGPISHIKLPKYRRKHSDTVEDIRRGLLDEIQDNNSQIVISSESFQNCDPRLVSQLFKGFQVEVVVYLREQVGFMASAYAQRVQASDYCGSLEEFCLANMSSDYHRFVESWSREFSGRITVKIYNRNELLQGDIVVDFCESILGLCGNTVKSLSVKKDPNPTLSSDLLEFKLRVNKNCTLPPKQAEQLYNGLANISITDSSGKIFVPRYLIENIAKHYDKTNRRIASKYFDREHLFSEFSQSEKIELSDDLELRLAVIRDKLISLHPELSESLSNLL